MGKASERLVGVIHRFRDCRVGVLGDLVADEFVYADIARVSREAPVLILDHQQTVATPGGGGNSVANLSALGAKPIPFGVVGNDDSGDRLIASLEHLDVEVSGILRREHYVTPTKSRILAGGVHTRRQQIVRLDRGSPKGALAPDVAEALGAALTQTLPELDGILIADYGYGAAAPQVVAGLTESLSERKLPLCVDSRSRVAQFVGCTACTPNQEELQLAVGATQLTSEEEVIEAATELLRQTQGQMVLATRGAQGMCLVQSKQAKKAPRSIPAYGTDEVADVTGAGDTVIAAFTLALIAGAEPEDAAAIANYAAGIVVTKAGTATLTTDELLRAVTEDTAS